jgi:hypothetical protein
MDTTTETKKRVHEGLVQGYLHPALKKKFLAYVNSKDEVSVSEMVAIAVQRLLESEGVIPKKISY